MGLKAIVPNLEEVDEKFHELYTKKGEQFELTGVDGMKTQADIDRIQAGLTKERNDHKLLKTAWSAIEMKPEDVRAALDRIPELEASASGKIDEPAIQKIVEGRVTVKLGPVQRELDKAKNDLAEANKQIETFKGNDRRRTISDAVRTAATKAKVVDTAIEDAVMLAERVMDVTEDGRVVTRDNVGVTPGLEPEAWLTDLQPKKTHWWGPSVGGGAAGSRTPGGGGANPFTFEHWNMTEQGKIVTANPSRADQLAKQAGTTVGGPKPAPRK